MSEQGGVKGELKLTDRTMLGLLAELEDSKAVTQRGLAVRLGVALGLVNSLLKRAIRKGLVKVVQVPARRYAYYVTPKGFGEKSRLVAEYLSSSLDFFRQARDEFSAVYAAAEARGLSRVVFFGTGELAEIAMLSARDSGLDVVGVVQPGANQARFSGLSVINSLDALKDMDIEAVVITGTDDPQRAYTLLREHFADGRILVAPLLHVSRQPDGEGAQ